MVERREHKRALAKKDFFVTSAANEEKIGQLIDIGKGGLAFRYIGGKYKFRDTFDIGIHVNGREQQLGNISVRTISDYEIVYQNPLSQIPLRRRGVQFLALSPHQAAKIESLIALADAE